jgi:hypothetical protein
MLSLIYAFRSTTVVLGIAAFASLLNRTMANSGVNEYLLAHQLGHLANAIGVFTYAFSVLVIAYFYAGFYWRDLFPERFNWLKFGLCFAIGLGFSVLVNQQIQAVLLKEFLGQPMSVKFAAFVGFGPLFTMSAISAVVALPFTDELTYHGILFREGERLPLWQLAFLSVLVQSLVQFSGGGLALWLAFIPASILFVATRLTTKSFVYSAATHIGFNLAALLKLQVF